LFPGLQTTGSVHQPGFIRESAGKFLSGASIGGVAYLFVGKSVLDLMQIQEPAFLSTFRENRYLSIGGYFICNWLTTQLRNTGAFEVKLNDVLLYSKLQTGRAPRIEETAALIALQGLKVDPRVANEYGLSYLIKEPSPSEKAEPFTNFHAAVDEEDEDSYQGEFSGKQQSF
jgi:selT/selW/selH-like putative selenoprotein